MSTPPTADPSTPERAWAHYTEPDHVAVDGLPTAYRRKGAGTPVVYLHGGGLTRMWLPFLDRLAQSADVIAPEHPGFGDTPLPDELDGFDDIVLHYDGFFDALGLDRVHLVGHSLGGWMAAELAVFYPRRFASLTLITPAGLRLRGVPSIDAFRMTPEEGLEALLNGRADRYEEYFVQDGFPEDLVRAFGEGAARARLTWNPRYDRKLDWRLSRVRTPTLVVGAEDDRMVPNEMVARYAELIPGARAVIVPGGDAGPTGHVPHLEHPDEVAVLVADHIAANGATA